MSLHTNCTPWQAGFPKPSRAARKLASPLLQVTEKTKPILVIHADNDRSVPVKQAFEMVAALEKAKVKHRFAHSTDKGHMGITPYVIETARAFINEIEGKGAAEKK